MRVVLLAPFLLQALAMGVDEGILHRSRRVGRLEWAGHLADTAAFLACLLFAASAAPTRAHLGIYLGLAGFSCLLITKDEAIHARSCGAWEHWLHALLFVLHPVVLGAAAWTWIAGEGIPLRLQAGLVLGFLLLQALAGAGRRGPPEPVDNSVYGRLGPRWYGAQDDPVALLRAESRAREGWVLAELATLGPPARVLDVGCGAGFMAGPLAAAGHRVTGVDLALPALRVARDRAGGASYAAMDASRLAFRDGSFDAVCMMDFLEHVEDPGPFVGEAARVLRPGGLFLFHTFNRTPLAGLVVILGVRLFVKNTPPRLHVLRLFVKPREVAAACALKGLKVLGFHGIRPALDRAFLALLATREVPEGFRFRFCRGLAMGYCGAARLEGPVRVWQNGGLPGSAMQEMDKAFDFKTAQQRWYGRWEETRLFEAKPDSGKEPWSIVIPPPNITGNLHMGHALVFTLHDILTRFKRARGYDALWLPGVDHAGIATQVVVERQVKETEGKTRHDLGREEFLRRLWSWKDQNQGDIENQLRRLGASVDWTRKRFTMDPDLNRAVRKVFAAAYKQGRIYRGPRMIQWDPASQTALSDLEVKYVERNGKLWHLKYPMADGSGFVVVATTRPETMLGDTGVAVHPEDERYAALVGKMVRLPLTDREIPVVADPMVDPKFGTGCVKLTPAHDPNDHAAALRLGLPSITVIGFDARMTKEAGEAYAGLDRFECRKKVVADLEALGLMEKIENYTHQVSVSDRSGAVLEPLVSEQWFMKVDDAAQKALEAVRSGRIRFTPERWATVWEHWLVNIQDWCISRQLWWGHRIPAWTCDACGHVNVEEDAPSACAKCGGTALTQDPDTLDTWFSSALWPFSVFGWPDETADLKRYYPTSVLITGYDILFFWVARMVMAGLTWMDDVPFRDVYFNSLVRDEHGAKMSKSKGNVIDPLETMDEFGTDALRYSLAAMAAPGTDISLSRSRLEASRNFCNKLWNAARFVQMSLTPDVTLDVAPELGEAEFWMIRRLREGVLGATKAIDEFRFHEAAEILYHLVWDDFCATYIELAKVTLQSGSREQKAAILHFLDILLRALHPLVPFVTEEIHAAVMEGRLPAGEPALLAARAWPSEDPLLAREGGDPDLVPRFQEALSALLRLKAENGVDPAKRVPAFCTLKALEPFAEGLKSIARLESVVFGEDVHGATRAVAVVTGGTVALELAGLKDPAAEKAKLEKEREKLEKELASSLARLADESFTTKAPEAAVAKMRAGAEEKQARLAKINELLAKG